MIGALIDGAIKRRKVVLGVTLIACVFGIFAYVGMPPGCAKTYRTFVPRQFENAPPASHGRRCSLRTEGVHRVEHVECQDGERRLRLHCSKAPREESAAARHPFYRAKGMLDGTSSCHHQARIGVNPGFHSI